jgi:ABC-type protease/lipase transport system fused ATPase/permease subunit
MSVALTFLLGHLRLVGYIAAALALLVFIGWIGHLVERHKRDARQLAVYESELQHAGEVNAETIAALARVTAEKAKAESALATAATKTQKRTASVAKITQEIDRVPVSPSDPVGPHVAAAIGELRQLKAGRTDQSPGGKDHAPGIAPGLPR